MKSGFAGKVALITGGSSGIGRAVAEELGAAGARVVVLASSSAAKAEVVAQGIVADGGEALGLATDVRDARAIAATVARIEQHFGGIDLLVNAAGVFYPSPVGETSTEDSGQLIDINVSGLWNAISATVPAMQRRGGGRIVNLASVAGLTGVKGFALYSASKAAVVMMTRTLAAELAPQGIAINAVAPGNTATPMNAAIRADPAMTEYMLGLTPSGTPFSAVADIARIVLFLLSEEARPVHGSVWLADEGISAAIG